MATPLLSLPRGWRAGQVAPSSAARLEAPAERLVAKDQAVHGFGGGQQVTTMLSVPIVKAPLMPPTATTLSARQDKHDSKSTHGVECLAKRPALQSKGRGVFARASSQCYRRPWPASQRRAFSDLLTVSGAVLSWPTWMPHPSGPRKGSPVEPRTIATWAIASDRAPSLGGGLVTKKWIRDPITSDSTQKLPPTPS